MKSIYGQIHGNDKEEKEKTPSKIINPLYDIPTQGLTTILANMIPIWYIDGCIVQCLGWTSTHF